MYKGAEGLDVIIAQFAYVSPFPPALVNLNHCVNTSYAEHLISIFPKSDRTHEVHLQIIDFRFSGYYAQTACTIS